MSVPYLKLAKDIYKKSSRIPMRIVGVSEDFADITYEDGTSMLLLYLAEVPLGLGDTKLTDDRKGVVNVLPQPTDLDFNNTQLIALRGALAKPMVINYDSHSIAQVEQLRQIVQSAALGNDGLWKVDQGLYHG